MASADSQKTAAPASLHGGWVGSGQHVRAASGPHSLAAKKVELASVSFLVLFREFLSLFSSRSFSKSAELCYHHLHPVGFSSLQRMCGAHLQ